MSQTIFHLTKNVIDQMNGFDSLLVVAPTSTVSSGIVWSANKSIQVKNYKKELSE